MKEYTVLIPVDKLLTAEKECAKRYGEPWLPNTFRNRLLRVYKTGIYQFLNEGEATHIPSVPFYEWLESGADS
jgi:hypothetical protein